MTSRRRRAPGGRPRGLLDLDEDALAGALLGGLDRGLFLAGRDVRHARGAARIGEHLVAFLHVRQAVVQQGEDVRGDLLAESVARAEILVDPDLHGGARSWLVAVGRWGSTGAR